MIRMTGWHAGKNSRIIRRNIIRRRFTVTIVVKHWKTSAPFPAKVTEENSFAELSFEQFIKIPQDIGEELQLNIRRED